MTSCNRDKELITGFDIIENENNTEKEEKPQYGGELALPLTTIKSLNPLLSENVKYYYFSKLIFESMFDFDNDLNIVNVLAKDYSIIDEGRVIDITLRDDVYWHDGEKFTSEDVKFTIDTIKYGAIDSTYKNLILSGVKPFSSSDMRHILDVKTTGDYSLEVVFDRSYSNGLEILTIPIIPKHVFNTGKNERENYANALAEDIKVIGTGPYMLDEYEKLKTVRLKANENWWNGKPYVEHITGKMLEDNSLVLTSFEAGQLDLANNMGVDWEKYAQNERVKMYEYVSQNYEFLAFNFSKEMFRGEKGRAIRKAIAYGIDRQAIIQKVYLGHATQIDVPINPNSWLISEDANTYGYNKLKAKEILENAGFVNVNGIFEDEFGEKLSITLTTNEYNPLRLNTAEIISENLNDIGIEVIKDYDVNIPDNVTEESLDKAWEEFENKINKGNFDVALLGWQLSNVIDLSFAFHSTQIKQGSNFIRYSDEKMDTLLEEAFNAENREKKKESYGRLQEYIVKELPYVSLFFRNESLLVDIKVSGNIEPNFNNVYNKIEQWYIPSEHQHK